MQYSVSLLVFKVITFLQFTHEWQVKWEFSTLFSTNFSLLITIYYIFIYFLVYNMFSYSSFVIWTCAFLPVYTSRLPEAHGGCGGNHNVAIPVPMAACVRAHPSRFPAALLGRPCALSHGPAVQRGHGPLQTRAASRGNPHTLAWSHPQTSTYSQIWKHIHTSYHGTAT